MAEMSSLTKQVQNETCLITRF